MYLSTVSSSQYSCTLDGVLARLFTGCRIVLETNYKSCNSGIDLLNINRTTKTTLIEKRPRFGDLGNGIHMHTTKHVFHQQITSLILL